MKAASRPLRAVIYARTSRASDSSTSIAGQVAECRDYCERQGWRVVEVIEEPGESGTERGRRLLRPGLLKVRQLYGEFDRLVFWRLDRLARSVIDLKLMIAETEENGAALVSTTEGFDFGTTAGRSIATIISVIAEMEAEIIRERTLGGKRRAAALGRFLGGPVPSGFRVVPTEDGGKMLEVDPERAELVKTAAGMIGAGETWVGVSRWLNTTDLRPPRSKQWTPAGVKAMLGADSVQQRILDATDRRVVSARRVVDRRPRGGKPKRVLSTMLHCWTCDTVMGSRGGVSHPDYRCSAVVYGTPCDGPVGISAERLDAEFEAAFLDGFGWMSTPLHRTQADAQRVAVAELDAEIERLRLELPTAAAADMAAIAARIGEAEGERDRLEQNAGRDDLIVFTTDGTPMRQHWNEADMAGRRDLIKARFLHGFKILRVGRGAKPHPLDRLYVRNADGTPGQLFREAAEPE